MIAPTWICSFNPRARAGRDQEINHDDGYGYVSIRAPARGATTYDATNRAICFNPRARAGRSFHFSVVSFNPRARAGRDLATADLLPVIICFNPRARAGRDCILQAG
jgi:hypothetical protein